MLLSAIPYDLLCCLDQIVDSISTVTAITTGVRSRGHVHKFGRGAYKLYTRLESTPLVGLVSIFARGRSIHRFNRTSTTKKQLAVVRVPIVHRKGGRSASQSGVEVRPSRLLADLTLIDVFTDNMVISRQKRVIC